MKYFARAPLRLGFAGGGTDINPYAENHTGLVLNATINQYCYSIIEPLNNNKIIFESEEYENISIHDSLSRIEIASQFQLQIAIYNRIVKDFNDSKPLQFHLYTYCNAPTGSGLGTSSTLAVSIIKAFSEWLDLALGNYEIASLAYEIERLDLNWLGGKQDQYSATFGGFNLMQFGPKENVRVNPLKIKPDTIKLLEISTVLYFTGISRESSLIIKNQIINYQNDFNRNSIEVLSSIKDDALNMKDKLILGDLKRFGQILNITWSRKKSLSNKISNKELDNIYNSALENGAYAGKISGAGGGGFFIFLVDPINRIRLMKYLSGLQGSQLNFKFTQEGCISWKGEC